MPQDNSSLYLQEEILLLALRDIEGTVGAEHTCRFAVAGAILAELLLAERIAVDDRQPSEGAPRLTRWLKNALTEKNLVNPLNRQPLGDPVLDEPLQRICSSKRRASLQTWIQRFANLSRLNHRIAVGLCRRGVLRADQRTVLLIFKRQVYPELDPKPESELRERLRRAIFTDSQPIDPRTAIVLSLADSANLLAIPFARKDLRKRRNRIKQITSGQLIGQATREAIQAVQAAMTAAAFVSVSVASTSCH